MPHSDLPVVVVGGGITGLLVARGLSERGRAAVVLEGSDRIGGQIDTVSFDGRAVDLGAEAVHLAAPATRALLDRIGLSDTTIASGPGSTLIGVDAPLRRIPPGVGPAGPTRFWPVVRSGLLSPGGLARAAMEPWIARRRLVWTDVSVREVVAGRFGSQVADRIVDPLLGGLHSGDISRLSVQAAAPQLAAMARSGRSITLSRKARRAAPSVAPAAFVTWRSGMGTLVRTVAEGLDVRCGEPVTGLRQDGDGWVVQAREPIAASAVVLAIPSRVAVPLLAEVAAQSAESLAGQRFASVATAVLAFDRDAVAGVEALRGTGILLGSTARRTLKAATFLSTKWPHLSDGEHVLVRVSAGRAGSTVVTDHDDETLVARMRSDLADLIGLRAEPVATVVRRWPDTMPQLEVGHVQRLAHAREQLPVGLEIAGASVDGVGIASCISSAQRVIDRLA